MIRFEKEQYDNFLGVVRKYMQLRGNLSQKDLSDMTGIGISTMSRFLNSKTRDIDEQLVANIVAKLNIPLHDIVEFIAEESTPAFKKLVTFYKEGPVDENSGNQGNNNEDTRFKTAASIKIGGRETTMHFGEGSKNRVDMTIKEKLELLSPRQKAYLTDFLDLDAEGKDLIVDLGNSLFRYFKQRGLEF